jgi:hypothetical protein
MYVLRTVRVAVVVAVVGGPPEDALLDGEGPEQRQDELEGPAGAKGPVGEVTVEPGGDSEHHGRVHAKCETGPPPGWRIEERGGQRNAVNGKEGNGFQPLGPVQVDLA